jgi:formyltetrahydrofolate-dependent phosphoribosylglycinamide formyltransferase
MVTRIAVLASGRGTNLRALHDHLSAPNRTATAQIVVVICDRADAGALELAASRGIPALAITPGSSCEAELARTVDAYGVDLIVLAGYLRLVPASIVRRYAGRVVNVHPALLPAFGGHGMYGMRVHRAVLESGTRVTGVSVHFVDEAYDRGAIIAQWPVPVFADDTEHTLAERVLRVEHLLLPRVVGAVAARHITLGPDLRVQGAFSGSSPLAAFSLARVADDVLIADIERALEH